VINSVCVQGYQGGSRTFSTRAGIGLHRLNLHCANTLNFILKYSQDEFVTIILIKYL